MKIKRINKIWKLSFVGLVSIIGLNLASCGHTDPVKQEIKDLKIAINRFHAIDTKNATNWNIDKIKNRQNSDNLLLLNNKRSDLYKMNDSRLNTKTINDFGFGTSMHLRGYYHLTGNANKDYTYLKSQAFILFDKEKTEFNKLVIQFESKKYPKHFSKNSWLNTSFALKLYFPDWSNSCSSSYTDADHGIFGCKYNYNIKKKDFEYDRDSVVGEKEYTRYNVTALRQIPGEI